MLANMFAAVVSLNVHSCANVLSIGHYWISLGPKSKTKPLPAQPHKKTSVNI